MATLIDTSFEAALADGWSTTVGTGFAVDTGQHYVGSQSGYLDKPASSSYLQLTLTSKRVVVGRLFLRIATDVSGTTPIVSCPNANGNLQISLRVGRKLRTEVGATFGADSAALNAGQWYKVDFRADSSGATATMEMKIDAVDAATASRAQAAADMTSFRVGGTGTNTGQYYFDAVKATDVSGDYPLAGPAQAVGTLPLLDAAAAVYAPAAQPDQFLTLGLLTSTSAVYTPTLGTSAAGLTLPLLDGSSTVYAPTAAISGASAQGLTLPILDGGRELYQPVAFIGTGVVVTVDQDTVAGQMAWAPGSYGVQRYKRGNSMTSGERAAATAVEAAIGIDLVTIHIGGGYQNANDTYQMFNQRDPMDSVGTYTWDSAANIGLDQWFGYLDELIALRPNAKMLLVLYDHPKAMLAGDTRASETPMIPWPASAEFAKYGPLLTATDARYPDKVWGVSWGQELKGFTNRTDVTALNNFADGFTQVATYVRAFLPTWKLVYPHVNLWATWSTIASRQAAMDALIAGGGLHTWDEDIYEALLARVDPDHVDYLSTDYSIVDNSTSDTWRGNYSAVKARVTMPYHVVRRLNEMMVTAWGAAKQIFALETYYDVRQADSDWATEAQQAALTAAMSIEFARAGGALENRWEPQGGDPLNPIMQSLWTENGVETLIGEYERQFRDAIPLGANLFPTVSTSADVIALGGGDNVYIVNLGTSAVTVFVSSAGVTLDPTVIPAYGYSVLELPTPTPSGPTPVVDDQFNRTEVDTWGTADLGGVVVMNTASRFDVTPGAGTIESGAGQTTRAVYADVTLLDSEGTYIYSTSALASGSAHETQLTLRQGATVDADYYSVNVVFGTDQSVALSLLRRVSGAQATITGPTAIGRETHAAGRQFNVVFEARGTSPTTVRAKIWQVGTSEPGSWDITATDSTGPQVAGSIGVRFFVGASSSTRIATFGRVALAGFTNDLALPLLDGGPLLYPLALVPDQLAVLALLDAAPAIYAPTVTARSYLTVPLLDASPAVYAPTAAALPVTVTVPLLDASPAVYAPQAELLGVPGAVLPLLDASAAVFAPTVLPQAITFAPPLLDAGPAVYAPDVLPGAIEAALPLLDAGPGVYAPDVQPAPWDIVLPVLDGGWAVYAPAASVTAATASLPFLDSGPDVYAPELEVTSVTFLLPLLDAHGETYTPDLTPTWAMTLPVLDASAAVYAPEIVSEPLIAGRGPRGSAWSPRPASRISAVARVRRFDHT